MIDWLAIAASILGAIAIVLPFIMLIVVPKDREPAAAIAWLLLIALIPLGGFLAYLVFGRTRLPRHRRRRQAEADQLTVEACAEAREQGEIPAMQGRWEGISRLAESLGALPPTRGNEVRLIDSYEGFYSGMAEEIGRAKSFVHVSFYIAAHDDATKIFLAALVKAAKRGVAVRVAFDHIGSRKYPGFHGMLKQLRESGVDVILALPIRPIRREWARPDLRNHRKIVVIDGATAFAGSQNLIEGHYHNPPLIRDGRFYEELNFQVTGPAASSLDAVFRTDWFAETGKLPTEHGHHTDTGTAIAQVVPSGPAHRELNNLLVFNALAYEAQHELVLTNPYFVPDTSFYHALVAAAKRGVKVTLITPERGDHATLDMAERSYYARLMEAGVRIAWFCAPGLLHSKTMRVDDEACVIGSSNLDMRSFHLNFEVSTIFYDKPTVAKLLEVEQRYLAGAKILTPEEWAERPVWRKYAERVMRLTSHLQ